MAIYYCDLYEGSDSNNGLSGSTPKYSLSACTNLCTSVNDSIRVRGTDNMSTNIGAIWWINGTLTFTGTTNLSAGVKGGDFIYKSTDAVPEGYYVGSTGWTGSVFSIVIQVNNGYYEGVTELVDVMKINRPVNPIPYSITVNNKDGYYSGSTTNVLARTGTTISGGWNSGFTERTGFTLVYNNNHIFSFNGKFYWDLSYFITLDTTGAPVHFFQVSRSKIENCAGMSSDGNQGCHSCVESLFRNFRLTSRGSQAIFNSWTCYLDNTIFRGGDWCFFSSNGANVVINSQFSNQSSGVILNNTSGIFIGNRFVMRTGAIHQQANRCYFSGNTFYNAGTSWITCYNNYSRFINNVFLPGSSRKMTALGQTEFINEGTNINDISTTAGYPSGPIFITESGSSTMTMPSSYIMYPPAISAYDPFDLYELYDVDYSVAKLKGNNNIILYNTASVQATGITYSGDTFGVTGQTGLKIYQYSSSYPARAGTIDMIVNSGTSYTLSFYVKSSNGQNFSWDYRYFGNYTNPVWITGTTSSSTWTNYSVVLPTITTTGAIKLFFKFTSGTGHYLYVSNISVS